MAATLGHDLVALTTGGRTETFAMTELRRERPELPAACFVQMGDFLRYALDEVVAQGIRQVVLGVMVGKLTKMGQGLAVTHAWKQEIDRDLLAACATEVGAPADLVEEIRSAETARFAAERLAALDLTVPFHRALAIHAMQSLRACHPGPYQLTVLVCDFEGQFICRVEESEIV